MKLPCAATAERNSDWGCLELEKAGEHPVVMLSYVFAILQSFKKQQELIR